MASWSLRASSVVLSIAAWGTWLPAAEDTFAQSLSTLGESGLAGTPEGLEAAQGAYTRAKRLAPQDGRVDYAWSLVLTKHRKFAEAEEAFQKSLGAPQLCLEARIAEVRSLLKSRKYTESLDRLIEVAELVGDEQLTHLTATERSAAATWIGLASGFLAGPLGDDALAASLQRRRPALVAYVGKWKAEFEQGERELSAEHRKLQEQLSLAIGEAEDKKVDTLRENEEKRTKLDSAFKSASTQGAKAQETATERLADIDSKLGSMETQYKNLLKTETRLSDSILQLNLNVLSYQREIERIDNQSTPTLPGVNRGLARQVYAQKIIEAQVEIELLQTDLLGVVAEKDRLQNQAGAAVRARMTALSDQQQLEMQKSKATAQYQKLQRTIQDESRKLAGTASSRAGRAPSLRMKIQSWGSYDKTTPQSEFAILLGAN